MVSIRSRCAQIVNTLSYNFTILLTSFSCRTLLLHDFIYTMNYKDGPRDQRKEVENAVDANIRGITLSPRPATVTLGNRGSLSKSVSAQGELKDTMSFVSRKQLQLQTPLNSSMAFSQRQIPTYIHVPYPKVGIDPIHVLPNTVQCRVQCLLNLLFNLQTPCRLVGMLLHYLPPRDSIVP
jgi:hypothetical protein